MFGIATSAGFLFPSGSLALQLSSNCGEKQQRQTKVQERLEVPLSLPVVLRSIQNLGLVKSSLQIFVNPSSVSFNQIYW